MVTKDIPSKNNVSSSSGENVLSGDASRKLPPPVLVPDLSSGCNSDYPVGTCDSTSPEGIFGEGIVLTADTTDMAIFSGDEDYSKKYASHFEYYNGYDGEEADLTLTDDDEEEIIESMAKYNSNSMFIKTLGANTSITSNSIASPTESQATFVLTGGTLSPAQISSKSISPPPSPPSYSKYQQVQQNYSSTLTSRGNILPSNKPPSSPHSSRLHAKSSLPQSPAPSNQAQGGIGHPPRPELKSNENCNIIKNQGQQQAPLTPPHNFHMKNNAFPENSIAFSQRKRTISAHSCDSSGVEGFMKMVEESDKEMKERTKRKVKQHQRQNQQQEDGASSTSSTSKKKITTNSQTNSIIPNSGKSGVDIFQKKIYNGENDDFSNLGLVMNRFLTKNASLFNNKDGGVDNFIPSPNNTDSASTTPPLPFQQQNTNQQENLNRAIAELHYAESLNSSGEILVNLPDPRVHQIYNNVQMPVGSDATSSLLSDLMAREEELDDDIRNMETSENLMNEIAAQMKQDKDLRDQSVSTSHKSLEQHNNKVLEEDLEASLSDGSIFDDIINQKKHSDSDPLSLSQDDDEVVNEEEDDIVKEEKIDAKSELPYKELPSTEIDIDYLKQADCKNINVSTDSDKLCMSSLFGDSLDLENVDKSARDERFLSSMSSLSSPAGDELLALLHQGNVTPALSSAVSSPSITSNNHTSVGGASPTTNISISTTTTTSKIAPKFPTIPKPNLLDNSNRGNSLPCSLPPKDKYSNSTKPPQPKTHRKMRSDVDGLAQIFEGNNRSRTYSTGNLGNNRARTRSQGGDELRSSNWMNNWNNKVIQQQPNKVKNSDVDSNLDGYQNRKIRPGKIPKQQAKKLKKKIVAPSQANSTLVVDGFDYDKYEDYLEIKSPTQVNTDNVTKETSEKMEMNLITNELNPITVEMSPGTIQKKHPNPSPMQNNTSNAIPQQSPIPPIFSPMENHPNFYQHFLSPFAPPFAPPLGPIHSPFNVENFSHLSPPPPPPQMFYFQGQQQHQQPEQQRLNPSKQDKLSNEMAPFLPPSSAVSSSPYLPTYGVNTYQPQHQQQQQQRLFSSNNYFSQNNNEALQIPPYSNQPTILQSTLSTTHHRHRRSSMAAICDDIMASIRLRSVSDYQVEENESNVYFKSTCWKRVFPERFTALLVTLAVEIPVLLMIAGGSDQLCHLIGRRRYQLIMAFLPLCCAISGNCGLQCSTLATRGITHNHITHVTFSSWLLKEIVASLLLGVGMGCVLALFAFQASGFDFIFAITIGFSQIVSIVSSSITGSIAPLFFNILFQNDAGKWSSLLETAVQDIVGCFTMVVLSYKMLVLLGPRAIEIGDTCGGVISQ